MRHIMIIIAMILTGVAFTQARVLDDAAKQVASLRGVTMSDTSAEMQADQPLIRTCNIITLSQMTLPMANAMLDAIPAEYGGVSAGHDNERVTVWANEYDGTDGEMLILINCGDGIALVYLDGAMDAMKASMGM